MSETFDFEINAIKSQWTEHESMLSNRYKELETEHSKTLETLCSQNSKLQRSVDDMERVLTAPSRMETQKLNSRDFNGQKLNIF